MLGRTASPEAARETTRPMSPENPRVAFAVPVYNGEAYLAEALEALQSQTETRWVAFVTDNASTDSTPDIVQAMASGDPRIRYVRNATNLGANGNFNRSAELALASGAPFVKWAAHDDRPHPGYLAACLEALDAAPQAVGAHTAIRLVDGEGEPYPYSHASGGFVASPTDVWAWTPEAVRTLSAPAPAGRFGSFLRIKAGEWMIFGLLRASALAATKPFALPGVEDALCAELLLRGPMLYVDETLFDHRLHGGSARHMSRADYLEYESGSEHSAPVLPSIGRAADFVTAIRRVPLAPRQRLGALATLAHFALGVGRLKNLVVPGPNNYLGLDFRRC